MRSPPSSWFLRQRSRRPTGLTPALRSGQEGTQTGTGDFKPPIMGLGFDFLSFGFQGEQPRRTVPTPKTPGQLALRAHTEPSAPSAPTCARPGPGRQADTGFQPRPRASVYLAAGPPCSPTPRKCTLALTRAPFGKPPKRQHGRTQMPWPVLATRGTRLETLSPSLRLHFPARTASSAPACSPCPTGSHLCPALPPPPSPTVPGRRTGGTGRGLPWSLAW